ncbi:MAG: hypothetical protein HZA90_14570 [Verrucomicrobia bacterium]|nr:hypothetical protein [Verrucomicrobiota bacterium]
MRQILHVLTKPSDGVTTDLIRRQSQQPETNVTVVDLTQPEPDYDRLVERVFAADSIMVS